MGPKKQKLYYADFELSMKSHSGKAASFKIHLKCHVVIVKHSEHLLGTSFFVIAKYKRPVLYKSNINMANPKLPAITSTALNQSEPLVLECFRCHFPILILQ